MVVTHDVDQVLIRAVDAGVTPGVVALAADEAGVIYAGAFGARAVGQDLAMGLDTVVVLASMTKVVTSVAALQLVEQGRVGLDEPLRRHLPDLAAVQVLAGFDAAGTPRLRSPHRPITLRHLLTHTAGFAYHIWNPDILRYHGYAGIPTIDEGKKACLTIPLACDPGERWEYGISTDWVGQMVEHVSGQSLDDYVRQHILNPLGMGDTGYVIGADQRSRLAGMHARQPDGSLQPLPTEESPQPEFWEGGGGLYSTGPDYLRLLRMLLGGGQLDGVRILQPETVTEMSRNQIGALTVGALTTALPEVSNTVEFFPGMVKQWGLCAMITTQASPAGRAAGSLAWGGIANTYFWIDPTRRVTGVLLTQILPFADAGVLNLFAQFERAIYTSHAARGRRPA
jgi:methyl acetate hydrolase